jgi:putative hydrolase of the HAD superfamily
MSSADYGLRKPHPSLFRAAVARLRLSLDEVWVGGDHLTNDVEGARAAGLTGVWYAPGASGAPEGVRWVRHWDQSEVLLAMT